MFNFFKSKPKQSLEETEKAEDVAASIKYVIKRGSDKALVDIELDDYDPESIDSLCVLLNTLGNDIFYIDTLNIIKESFIKENREDILIKIFTKVSTNSKMKMLHTHNGKTRDEPCIKPSDML